MNNQKCLREKIMDLCDEYSVSSDFAGELWALFDEEANKLQTFLDTPQHHLHDAGAYYRNKLKEVLEMLKNGYLHS